MIIDFHTHYTPPTMRDDLAAFSEKEPYWGLLITPDPVNHTEQGWATPEQMVDDMDKAGVDKAVLLGVYRQTAENSFETNNDTISITRQFHDRILGFGVVAPKPLDKAIDEIKRCADHGLIGIGELNPYAQGVSFNSKEFCTIAEKTIELGLLFNIHCNEEVGHFYLGKSPVRLMDYYEFACRFPEMKLIMSHWGGGLIFYEIMPEVRKKLQHVYYDLAGTPLMFPTDRIFKMGLMSTDHRKLLYGSDYPLIICPGKQQGPDFVPFLEEIKALDLDGEVFADIMGRNGARLLGMDTDNLGEEVFVTSEGELIPKETPAIEKMSLVEIDPFKPVSLVAHAYPETQKVFERYGIPWKDSPVAYWEPIAQAAAAHGYSPKMRQIIINELKEAAKQ